MNIELFNKCPYCLRPVTSVNKVRVKGSLFRYKSFCLNCDSELKFIFKSKIKIIFFAFFMFLSPFVFIIVNSYLLKYDFYTKLPFVKIMIMVIFLGISWIYCLMKIVQQISIEKVAD